LRENALATAVGGNFVLRSWHSCSFVLVWLLDVSFYMERVTARRPHLCPRKHCSHGIRIRLRDHLTLSQIPLSLLRLRCENMAAVCVRSLKLSTCGNTKAFLRATL
jgi:hypothetical protein